MNVRRLSILVVMGLLLLLGVRRATAAGDVVVLEIDGVVSPGMVAYFERGIDEALLLEAEAVVIVLDTPGGDGNSMLEIAESIRGAALPVIVYVGPVGAQASSAGAVVTISGHLSAMAPGSVIGASSPISADGQDLPETAKRKAIELIAAEVRSLTEGRSDEARALAESMITDARAVSATEALEIGLIDVIAEDVDDLLRQIDGREVILTGEVRTLDVAGADVLSIEPSLLEQFQLALVNSGIIATLLSIGGVLIILELRAPGGWVAGFLGVMSLLLAFYGLGQIPNNYFGLGLVALAFILYVVETQTPTFGVLTLTGTLTLFAGLIVLFNTGDAPEWIRLSIATAAGIVLPVFVMFMAIAVAMARSQRAQPRTGAKGMIGMEGVVTRTFKPYGDRFRGMVLVHGELWRAEGAEPLPADYPVIVDKVDGFTVHVRKAIVDFLPLDGEVEAQTG